MPQEIGQLLSEADAALNTEPSLSRQHAMAALEKAIASGNGKGIAESYYLLGKVEYLSNNAPAALEHFKKAIQHAAKANDYKTLASSQNNAGLILFQSGQWAEAKEAYHQSLEIKERLKDERGIAISCSNLGGVFFQTANYPQALHYFVRAQTIFDALGEASHAATATYNAGLIHSIDKNYESAIRCYQLALQKLAGDSDTLQRINVFINLGDAYRELRLYEQAKKYLEESIALSRQQQYLFGEMAALANLSELHMNLLEYNQAEDVCRHLLQLDSSINKNARVVAHLNLGRIHFIRDEMQKAKQYLQQALHLTKEIENKHHLKDVLNHLIHVHEKLGDYKMAFENQKEYQTIREELYDSRIDRKLAEIQFQHDLETKQKETEIERLRNVELKAEKDKSDSLLKNILPDEVAEELKNTGQAAPRLFEHVTVIFTDFVSFTKVSERLTPQELVQELHECFKAFDEICEKYGLEKIKTIGDAYLAVSGLPAVIDNHAELAIHAAQEIIETMRKRKEERGDKTFGIRVGLNSGRVIAGIVGVKKFAYDIWGDTVNTAARMEQNGQAGRVNISEATYELVKDQFICEYRGEIEAKNKGKLKMYFVEG
jgi:adenylate cyclase